MKYIRTENGIYELDSEKKFYAIRDTSVNNEKCYVSWFWDNWKNYFLTDSLNCCLFSYNSAQCFINDLMKEKIDYKNLVIEINQYYKNCQQADTIEELCDEFVGLNYEDKPVLWSYELAKGFAICDLWKPRTSKCIYGAIWTSSGLIYVAEFNENGELVLI